MRSRPRTYRPDRWEIIKFVNEGETYYKIIGDWSGSYLEGRSWRLSSGVSGVREEGDHYLFDNYSGSVYECSKRMKSLGVMSSGIYKKIEEEIADLPKGVTCELISVEQLKQELEESKEADDNSN